MRSTEDTNGSRTPDVETAASLAMRVYREDVPVVLPANRALAAALTCLGLAALMLFSSGCTVGQTRFMLGATLVADATTTQSAISQSSASEGNPVLQKAPIPIMLVLSGIVALVAEHEIKNGNTTKAKNLYRIASAVHGAAALWNGYQMGSASNSSAATSTAARPSSAVSSPTRGVPLGSGSFRLQP